MGTILITGGAGFIGSNIAAALADHNGHDIIVCDRFHSSDKWRNLRKAGVTGVVLPEDLFSWLERHRGNIEAIIHMGAVSSTTETDVDKVIRSNYTLTNELWKWARTHESRFIYASSAATYGDGAHGFKDGIDLEYLRTLQPLNPYAWSKQLFDLRVARYVVNRDPLPPQWVGLKFFNVFGPNEYHKGNQRSVAIQLFEQLKAGVAAKLFKSYHPDYGDGGQLRDFIYVRDCVHVVQWLLDNPRVSGLFNVGTGQARSFLDLANATAAALGREPRADFIEMPAAIQPNYQYFTQADIGALRNAGYNAPFTSLEEGVKDYIQRYLQQDDPYR